MDALSRRGRDGRAPGGVVKGLAESGGDARFEALIEHRRRGGLREGAETLLLGGWIALQKDGKL